MKKKRNIETKLIKKMTMSLALTLAITATALFTPLMPQATIEAEAVSYDMSIDMHCEPAWEVLDIVNQERAKVGVEPLQMDGALMATAYVRANEIVQLYSHTRPNGEYCYTAFPLTKGKARGENIYASPRNAVEAMDGWMNSTGHRRNILNPKYKAIGIYEVFVPGSQWEYYWVQCFRDVLEDPILPGGAPTNAVTTKDGSIPMYRLYNPYTGEHFYTANHYTTDAAEISSLCAAGWKNEGVGWYGIR